MINCNNFSFLNIPSLRVILFSLLLVKQKKWIIKILEAKERNGVTDNISCLPVINPKTSLYFWNHDPKNFFLIKNKSVTLSIWDTSDTSGMYFYKILILLRKPHTAPNVFLMWNCAGAGANTPDARRVCNRPRHVAHKLCCDFRVNIFFIIT